MIFEMISKLFSKRDLEKKYISFAKVLESDFHKFSVCGDQEVVGLC